MSQPSATDLPKQQSSRQWPHRQSSRHCSRRLPALRTQPQSGSCQASRALQSPAQRREPSLSSDRRWPLGIDGTWLGIPVEWDEISGARVIVEAGFRDFRVTPSQGSHFFQNLTAFRIGYFTVNPDAGEGSVDWQWLAEQSAVEEQGCVRHLHFAKPIRVVMNSRTSQGVIFKPDVSDGASP